MDSDRDTDYDDAQFDEDWSAEEDDLVTCPECRAEVYLELNDDRCPECGHWFLESDRAGMRQQAGSGVPLIYKIAAIVLLLAIVLPMLLLLLE